MTEIRVCLTCLEHFNVEESDADDSKFYCSATCETKDIDA